MKIAMFGHKRIPSREGGVEIVVEELAARMAELGHRVTCYNRAGHHVSGAAFDGSTGNSHRGIRLKTVPTLDKKGLAAVTSSFFAAICAAFSNADVVHIHAEGPALMCWLPRLMGKRVVVTVHGLDWQRSKWKGGFAAKYIRLGEKAAVRFAHRIIVLSRNVQQYFLDTYGRETDYIPNGVTLPEIVEPAQIRAMGLEKDNYILFLGRLVPEKCPDLLIRAYRKLNTDKKLVIAGGSSDSDSYAAQLKQLAGDNPDILFTGFVQGRLLQELYSNAYLYVLPSNLEGMPLSLLEAMSYGNCCLTSDIEECASVTCDAGVTFKQGNISDLAGKLEKLCDSPDRVTGYKQRAADHVLRRYNWDEITQKTLELYR